MILVRFLFLPPVAAPPHSTLGYSQIVCSDTYVPSVLNPHSFLYTAGVGKSNLLLRFSKNQYCERTKPTVGVEFATKVVQIEGNKLIRAQIWDTAGQERYRLIASTYYRRAMGALLVYDVTNRKSFDNITRWLAEVRDIVGEHCLVMMIGNKIDLASQSCSVVSTAEGKELAMKHKIAFIETSAKENKGVTAAFQHLLQAIYNLDMHNNQQLSTTTATTRQDQGFILRNPILRNGTNGSHYGDNTRATTSDTALNQKPIVLTRCCNTGG